MYNCDVDLLPPTDIKTVSNAIHMYCANIADAISMYTRKQHQPKN